MKAETKNVNKRVARGAALNVCTVAIMAASLTAFKFALSFIPNVEVVTVLILVYASVFGVGKTLLAVFIFCSIEVGIYGVGSWVLLYFVFFGLLALLAGLLLKKRHLAAAVILAGVMSVFFGVLSACCDTLFLVAGLTDAELAAYFAAYYIRGLYFDLVHVASNLVIVFVLYKPLVYALCKVVGKPAAFANIEKEK